MCGRKAAVALFLGLGRREASRGGLRWGVCVRVCAALGAMGRDAVRLNQTGISG